MVQLSPPVKHSSIILAILRLLLLSRQLARSSSSLESSSQYPPGLTLSKYSSIINSEATTDFTLSTPNATENFFLAATQFEWDRSLRSPRSKFPFVVCNNDPTRSGYQRLIATGEAFGTTAEHDTSWTAISNTGDESCFLVHARGRDLKKSYFGLSLEAKELQEYLAVQPVIMSMKMGMGFVEGMKMQFGWNFAKALFIVTFCPGVIDREGSYDDVFKEGNETIQTIQTASAEEILATSFFYNYGKSNSTGGNSSHIPVTSRGQFWADILEDGNGTCSSLISTSASVMEFVVMYDTIYMQVNFEKSIPTEIEQMCLWFLIENVALDNDVCGLYPALEVVPQLGGDDLVKGSQSMLSHAMMPKPKLDDTSAGVKKTHFSSLVGVLWGIYYFVSGLHL